MRVASASDFDSFRTAARGLLAAHVAPHDVSWDDALQPQATLFAAGEAPTSAGAHELKVPRRYVELAQLAVLVRAPDRFDLAYRVLHRLLHTPRLLDDGLDADVRELTRRVQSVRHDEHRMHAFVRFRCTESEGQETFVAWYEPQHFIVPLAAPFFQRRFASQRWAILTPDECAYWDGETLCYGPGTRRSEAPRDDQLEGLFRTYYQATFNPARVNPALFQRHVPRAFQRDMPELQGVLQAVHTPAVAAHALPEAGSLAELAAQAAGCRNCPLGERATQTVFGHGPRDAALCLVGEQPGDEEDLRGVPFVGPAGQVLARALHEAGLQRDQLYVTNAVKHFSFRQEGKKRLHVTPKYGEVQACKPWLEAELALLQPRVLVCLGATAAQAFLGRRFSVTQNRTRVFQTPWAQAFLVSYHPSAVLRAGDEAASANIYRALVEDLTHAKRLCEV